MKKYLILGLIVVAQSNAMVYHSRFPYYLRPFNPQDGVRPIDKSRLNYSLHEEINNNDPIGVKLATILAILKQGADVNAPDSNGNTPLMNACIGGNPEVIKILLNHRFQVNVNAINHQPGAAPVTALIYAAIYGKMAAISCLLADQSLDLEVASQGKKMLEFAQYPDPLNPQWKELLPKKRLKINLK